MTAGCCAILAAIFIIESSNAAAEDFDDDCSAEFLSSFLLSVTSGDFLFRKLNIVACFVGGKYSAETSLEIRNGETFNLYKPYNLMQAGNETRDGLEINLKKNFKIKAQNSHETLVLSLEIKENSTGRSMYNDAAGKYGVIHVSN